MKLGLLNDLKIGHKQIAILIGLSIVSFGAIKTSDYLTMKKELNSVLAQAEDYRSQNSVITSSLENNNSTSNIVQNADLSYYASNIYAYALVENLNVEVRNGISKYKDTIQLNVTHEEIKDKEKHKAFLTALSYLGFIENVTKQSLTLNVYKFSINDAKDVIATTNSKDSK